MRANSVWAAAGSENVLPHADFSAAYSFAHIGAIAVAMVETSDIWSSYWAAALCRQAWYASTAASNSSFCASTWGRQCNTCGQHQECMSLHVSIQLALRLQPSRRARDPKTGDCSSAREGRYCAGLGKAAPQGTIGHGENRPSHPSQNCKSNECQHHSDDLQWRFHSIAHKVWTSSHTSFWKSRLRLLPIKSGTFVFHQFAASGCLVSRIAMAGPISTAKPLLTDTRPRKSRPRKPRKVGEPSSTPDDRTFTCRWICGANGNSRPTHFSRTHRGAWPGGIPTIRIVFDGC